MNERREKIVTLLTNYMEVEIGLQDRAFRGDDFLPRMCRSWNHPSYIELRRVIAVLQSLDPKPRFRWHLEEQFFRYRERTVAWCPRCTAVYPVIREGDIHRHGQSTVKLVRKTIRDHLPVSKARVDEAVGWIDDQFIGEPFIPDDLLALVA